jgi:hypothetical protein
MAELSCRPYGGPVRAPQGLSHVDPKPLQTCDRTKNNMSRELTQLVVSNRFIIG